MWAPRPWDRDRRDVTYPNISLSGTRTERWLTSMRRSTEVTRPRRAFISPLTPPSEELLGHRDVHGHHRLHEIRLPLLVRGEERLHRRHLCRLRGGRPREELDVRHLRLHVVHGVPEEAGERPLPDTGLHAVGDLLREREHPEPGGDLDPGPAPAGAKLHNDLHGHQTLRDLALEHLFRGAPLGDRFPVDDLRHPGPGGEPEIPAQAA